MINLSSFLNWFCPSVYYSKEQSYLLFLLTMFRQVTGGYYADMEADCQLFHVCVQVSEYEVRMEGGTRGPGTII